MFAHQENVQSHKAELFKATHESGGSSLCTSGVKSELMASHCSLFENYFLHDLLLCMHTMRGHLYHGTCAKIRKQLYRDTFSLSTLCGVLRTGLRSPGNAATALAHRAFLPAPSNPILSCIPTSSVSSCTPEPARPCSIAHRYLPVSTTLC